MSEKAHDLIGGKIKKKANRIEGKMERKPRAGLRSGSKSSWQIEPLLDQIDRE